jgi:hypothetical protein
MANLLPRAYRRVTGRAVPPGSAVEITQDPLQSRRPYAKQIIDRVQTARASGLIACLVVCADDEFAEMVHVACGSRPDVICSFASDVDETLTH